MSELVSSARPDISKPQWDQSTFEGRARHFYSTANPLNVFISEEKLQKSRKIVMDYRKGIFAPNLTVAELWEAKKVYDSAFHPESGEKMFVLGRMSCQVPCNMLITGGMLTFHKRFLHVVAFQWINQSFNAIVNYTNRSGGDGSDNQRLLTSYLVATTGAVTTALGANHLVSKMKKAPPLLGALVPFMAIALANALNIPMMRRNEFTEGIQVENDKGEVVGKSKRVPYFAIPQVIVSRVGMAVPNMVFGPIIYNALAKGRTFKNWQAAVLQVAICGLMLTFSTPFCCALFPQRSSIHVKSLEPQLQEKLRFTMSPNDYVYYNKGL